MENWKNTPPFASSRQQQKARNSKHNHVRREPWPLDPQGAELHELIRIRTRNTTKKAANPVRGCNSLSPRENILSNLSRATKMANNALGNWMLNGLFPREASKTAVPAIFPSRFPGEIAKAVGRSPLCVHTFGEQSRMPPSPHRNTPHRKRANGSDWLRSLWPRHSLW